MEHARWNAERILAGYHPPTEEQLNEFMQKEKEEADEFKKDLQSKMIHLHIVPFDALNEEVKAIDRKLVKAIPTILNLASQK